MVKPRLLTDRSLTATPEGELALVIQLNLVQAYVRNAASIDEAAFLVDPDQLQHAVLVQMGRPPFGIEGAAFVAEITGTCPAANLDAVDIKENIRWIVIAISRSLRTKLNENWISRNDWFDFK